MRDKKQDERAPRVATNHAAILIDAAGNEIPVVVTDLSKGGFRLLMKSPPAVGESIRLRVAKQGDYEGSIKWVNATEAGGSFVTNVGTL